MQIYSYENKGIYIVKLSGDIDHLTASKVKDAVSHGILKYKSNKVIIDLKDVYFMDSSGIGMLIGRYKELSLYCGEVVLSGINKSIDKILSLSGLYKIIKTFENTNSAMRYFLEEK